MVTFCVRCRTEHAEGFHECALPLQNTVVRRDHYAGRTILNRYRVKQWIGGGGNGLVYEAERIQPGGAEPIVLKFIHRSKLENPEHAQRMVNEGRALMRLTHRNAIRCFDIAVDAETGAPFLCLERYVGEDLERILSRTGRLPSDEALHIALVLADVLAEAHEKGIVHKDLKPSNVLVRPSPSPCDLRLIDFGIARLVGDPRVTAEGLCAGSPAYASPEQCTGQDVDGRSDIYSLGILTFELLTGTVPFTAPSQMGLLQAHQLLAMPKLHERCPDLAAMAGLDELLQKATAKAPSARHQTARELAAALRAVTRQLGLTEIGPEHIGRPRTVPRNQQPSWFVAPDVSPEPTSAPPGSTAPGQPIDLEAVPRPTAAPVERAAGPERSDNESAGARDITMELRAGLSEVELTGSRSGESVRASIVHLAPADSVEWQPIQTLPVRIQLGPGRNLRLPKGWYFSSVTAGRTPNLPIVRHGTQALEVRRRSPRPELYIMVDAGFAVGESVIFDVDWLPRLSVRLPPDEAVVILHTPHTPRAVLIVHFIHSA